MLISVSILATETIKLGISRIDADQNRLEFEQYGKLAAFYQANGIKASLLEYRFMIDSKYPVATLSEELRKFHVVLLQVDDEGIYTLTKAKTEHAKGVAKVLADYVKNGGGLVIEPRAVRYPGNDDEKYWNLIFQVFGFQLEREGIADKTTMIDHEHKTAHQAKFFHTSNILRHSVTKGIHGLWLPIFSFVPLPATPLITYSADWHIVIRANTTGKSFHNSSDNTLDLSSPGTISSAPPICAVREFGEGRVAVLAADRIYSGQNFGVPSWSHIVETRGTNGKPGELMKLLTNLLQWTAEPALKKSCLGTYHSPEFKKVEYPASISWDNHKFRAPEKKQCRGIVGAHSSFAGGKSTVAEYISAAKKAGLQFIVFTDPLEKSSKENFNALKKACADASDKDFLACPGAEFTDGSGIRWIFFGPKVEWPDEKVFYKNGHPFRLWDGKTIQHYGRYATQCSYPGSAIIDYGQLQKNKIRPENLWWFYHLIPYAYDHGKLIADNYRYWSFSLRDLRWIVPITFTRIDSSAEVAEAAQIAITSAKDMAAVYKMLSTRCAGYHLGKQINQQISFGITPSVTIHNFQTFNDQSDPRILQTRGTQRVRSCFTVSSANGLKDAVVMDAVSGVIRRFEAHGVKELSREFELVHDRQHAIWLEATDLKGNKAISHMILLFNYKQGLFRCNDNLNILGPLGFYWHPDRHQLLPFHKTLRTAELYSVQGWDRGGPDCPIPYGYTLNQMYLQGIGETLSHENPDKRYSMQMNVILASNDLQVVDATMDSIVEGWDSEKRPGPSFTSPARKISANPYFVHTQRMYSPRDRMNHHVAWDYRRLNESLEEYDGSFQFFEGEITFQKTVTLEETSPIPIELAVIQTDPSNAMEALDDTVFIADRNQSILRKNFKRGKKQDISGRIAADGFAALLNSSIGYLVMLPVKGEFRYYYHKGRLYLGIGNPGQTYKAGEKLRYAYISGVFTGKADDGKKIKLAGSIFRHGMYPHTVDIGMYRKTPFFFEIAATGNEARFILGPQQGLGIDLPVRIRGIEDNGCIAVHSSQRPWLRFVSMATDGAVYFQEPMEKENSIWAGNVFLASDKALKLTLVMDGQDSGKQPFLEIHNPTNGHIVAKIWSPKHTPYFGGNSFEVDVPAGSSVFRDTQGRSIRFSDKAH